MFQLDHRSVLMKVNQNDKKYLSQNKGINLLVTVINLLPGYKKPNSRPLNCQLTDSGAGETGRMHTSKRSARHQQKPLGMRCADDQSY
jgi:hypothetical protein